MIGRIRGILIEKLPPEVVIDVGGVGYEIQMPMSSFYKLPETGQETIVFTHFVVRDDAQLLFGFANKGERAIFRELIKANGVGPKLALTILSGMSAEQFMHCVQQADVNALVKLPGVGKKTAERLVVELKDRLDKLHQSGGAVDLPVLDATGVENTFVTGDTAQEEAISALVALGYKAAQADKAIKKIAQQGQSSEDLIREALRAMV